MPYALIIVIQLMGAPETPPPGQAAVRYPDKSTCLYAKDAVMAAAKAIPFLHGLSLRIGVACVAQPEV